MAAKNEQEKTAPSAAREAVKETDAPKDAETFDHEWLIGAASGIGGFKPEEVAGALSAVSKKNLTIEEAKAAVETWLSSPVKTEA